MSGGLITIVLAIVVVIVAILSSRRGEGQAGSRVATIAMFLGAVVIAGALILFFRYRRP